MINHKTWLLIKLHRAEEATCFMTIRISTDLKALSLLDLANEWRQLSFCKVSLLILFSVFSPKIHVYSNFPRAERRWVWHQCWSFWSCWSDIHQACPSSFVLSGYCDTRNNIHNTKSFHHRHPEYQYSSAATGYSSVPTLHFVRPSMWSFIWLLKNNLLFLRDLTTKVVSSNPDLTIAETYCRHKQ